MLSASMAARLKVGRTTETIGDLQVDDCSTCAEPSNARSTCAESTSQVLKAILFRVSQGLCVARASRGCGLRQSLNPSRNQQRVRILGTAKAGHDLVKRADRLGFIAQPL